MADYTRDQLMQALRDADAAGDEASARVIAGRIQSLGSTPKQQEPPPDDSYSGRFWRIWQNTKDEARLAANTFGTYDRMAADQGGFRQDASGRWVQGGDIKDLDAANAAALAAERAKTEAASQRIGPGASAIANAAGYGPFLLAPGGGLAAGTAAGAGLGFAAATGRGEDPVQGALTGGVSGLGGGILGKGANWGLNRVGTAIGKKLGWLPTQADVTIQNPTNPAAADLQKMSEDLKGFKVDPSTEAHRMAGGYVSGSPEYNALSEISKAEGGKTVPYFTYPALTGAGGYLGSFFGPGGTAAGSSAGGYAAHLVNPVIKDALKSSAKQTAIEEAYPAFGFPALRTSLDAFPYVRNAVFGIGMGINQESSQR